MTRLVLAVAGTMAVVLLGSSAFVFWRVGYALNRQLDQDLTAYEQVVARAVSTGSTPPVGTPGQSFEVYDLRGRQDQDRTRLVVSDEGPGFAPEFVDKAFDRFTRADVSRTTRGVGLGLALVRAVADAHGGTASISGSSVVIELPASPTSA